MIIVIVNRFTVLLKLLEELEGTKYLSNTHPVKGYYLLHFKVKKGKVIKSTLTIYLVIRDMLFFNGD